MNVLQKFDLSMLYMEHVNASSFHYDEEQYKVINEINDAINYSLRDKTITDRIKMKFSASKKNTFYIYGSVGSGKSFITNLVFKNFPVTDGKEKIRLTFYNLIDELRNQVNFVLANKNTDKNLLVKRIIKEKFENVKLLCIDEFHILDIADATMIGEFLKLIFKDHDMIIMINSNRHPMDLYKDGIQKERFVPIIDLIIKNSNIIHLTTKDYRNYLKSFPKNYFIFSDNYPVKNSEDFKTMYLENNFNKCNESEITILSQRVHFIENTHFWYRVIYFDFHELFDKNFYAKNYQDLIDELKIKKIFINNIPMLTGHDNWAKRFIAFIDIVYENSVHLVLSSHFMFTELYTKGPVVFEFNRTISRINVLCN
jgi:cell division protein ZapE